MAFKFYEMDPSIWGPQILFWANERLRNFRCYSSELEENFRLGTFLELKFPPVKLQLDKHLRGLQKVQAALKVSRPKVVLS